MAEPKAQTAAQKAKAAADNKAKTDTEAAEKAKTYSGKLTYSARIGNKTFEKGPVDGLSKAQFDELVALKAIETEDE